MELEKKIPITKVNLEKAKKELESITVVEEKSNNEVNSIYSYNIGTWGMFKLWNENDLLP